MRIADAFQQAVTEFADPACHRCHGRGYAGALREDTLCACVGPRVPRDPAGGADDALPHPWGAITRRAQQLHAAHLLECTPDNWG
jgi:hypothetical protein